MAKPIKKENKAEIKPVKKEAVKEKVPIVDKKIISKGTKKSVLPIIKVSELISKPVQKPKELNTFKDTPKAQKVEATDEPKAAPMVELKVEPFSEIKVEQKPETTSEIKLEIKPEMKAEPTSEQVNVPATEVLPKFKPIKKPEIKKLSDLKLISPIGDDSNKQKVEALLFASGKKMEVSEIARVCEIHSEANVLKLLNTLKKDYEDHKSALMFVDEGASWKITVREAFLPVVRKIVADTELTKSVMETLAVIAWKFPISQNSVIKIRSNKAYDHIKELEEMGFIKKERTGRTYALKLTDKFFSYFDVNGKNIKQMLAKIGDLPPKVKDGKLGGLAIYTQEAPKTQEVQKPGEEVVKIGPLEVYGLPDKENSDIDAPIKQDELVKKVEISNNLISKKEEEQEENTKEDSDVIENEIKDKKSKFGQTNEDDEEVDDDNETEDSEDQDDEGSEKKEEPEEDEPPKRIISDELANLLSNGPKLDFSRKKTKAKEEEEPEEDTEERRT